MVKLEEKSEVIEGLIARKLRLIKQKEEMTDLVKSVELNIQPTEFKNLLYNSTEDKKDKPRGYFSNVEEIELALENKNISLHSKIISRFETVDKDGKKAYTKALLKAMIDTECMDFALDAVPYEMLDPSKLK